MRIQHYLRKIIKTQTQRFPESAKITLSQHYPRTIMSDSDHDDEKIPKAKRSRTKPHFITEKTITEIPMYVTYARPRWPASHQAADQVADLDDGSKQETPEPPQEKDG